MATGTKRQPENWATENWASVSLYLERFRGYAARRNVQIFCHAFFVFSICRVAGCPVFRLPFLLLPFFSVALLFAVAVFAVNHAEGCPMLAVLLRTHCSAGNIVRLMA